MTADAQLKNVVDRLADKRVLLLGDTIVDIYVYGTVLGTSAETPTIVARELETKTFLGGAFLVARHLLELGAHVTFVTLVGHDAASESVTGFSHPRFELVPVRDAGRKTTVKKRFWVDGYKLLQFDQLDNRPLSENLDKLSAEVGDRMRASDVAVVSDYRHGLMSPPLIASTIAAARARGRPLYVDSQVSQSAANHTLYRGADVVCLNLKEARAIDPKYDADAAGGGDFSSLIERLGVPNVVVKLGERGSVAWVHERRFASPAAQVKVVDTCGAGDAFLAAFCLAGLDSPATALSLANRWAGLSITVHGTVPPRREELLQSLSGQ
jgi:rfaE bifunctional protein kinase chain/domain